MDLHQLKVFREAARTGGFTRASNQLHLSQSTVSLHIKRLEEELGTQLFSRTKRRVQLNKAGERLLPFVERIFQELRSAGNAVREMSQVERGMVRIGSGATTVTYLLPKILQAFQRRYPEVELIVMTGSTESLLQGVEQQTLDLAVVMPPSRASQQVEILPVLREELVYVIAAGHPLAQKHALAPADLNGPPFIAYLHDSVMQRLLEDQLAAMGAAPRITMEMENIEAIKALIRAGLGGAILPLCSVAGAQGTGLRVLRIRKHRMDRELALALPARGGALPIAQRLAGRILRTFSGKEKSARN